MNTLALGDWIVIGAYLAGILAFGLWSGRGQKSTRDYFLGKEDIPWWGVGLSIVATETSALTFISVPAMAYGGYAGHLLAGGIVGAQTAGIVARSLVVFGMALGVVGVGSLFAVLGAMAGALVGAVTRLDVRKAAAETATQSK